MKWLFQHAHLESIPTRKESINKYVLTFFFGVCKMFVIAKTEKKIVFKN